jgi:RND family efflux transporter MFP subunit
VDAGFPGKYAGGSAGMVHAYWAKRRLPMKRNNRILYDILIFFGLTIASGCESINASEETQPIQKVATPAADNSVKNDNKIVKVLQVKSVSHVQNLVLSGKALAKKESTLSLSVSGMIKEIPVQLGDRVKAGDVMLKLDRQNYVLGVQQAEAGLAAAVAQSEMLENEMVRLRNLVKENAAPAASIDDLTAQKKGANAQVQISKSNLDKARKALKDSVLRAPFDGVVTNIMVEKGEQCYAMPPTMLMTIVDASTLEVQVFVPEEASSKVRVGDGATVTIDSVGVATEGVVTFVANTISQGARTFEVRVEVGNADLNIKAGAFARVNLNQDAATNVIFVPVAAVKRDENDEPYIFKVHRSIVHKQPVTLGPMEDTRVIIREGLVDGDEIVVSTGAGNVIDGQRVRTEKL